MGIIKTISNTFDNINFALVFILILISTSLFGVQFGRNKVQYKQHDWYYLTSTNFDIYYPQDYDTLANFSREILEGCLQEIKEDLGYEITKPIPIVIYPSQNTFIETNITTQILTERVGGFTEIFKDRVVIPFTGSYEELRQVLRHEVTHAVVFDMIYGRSPTSLLSPQQFFKMPLWFAEGLSEYEAEGWNHRAAMYMRDALFNDKVVPFKKLGGFFLYKQGQSVVKYIADKYGDKKLGEIIGKGKIHIRMNDALKAAIGIDQKQLYKDWLNFVQKKYYPEIDERRTPDDLAAQITFHKKDGSHFNTQPVYSPNGAKIAYFSDKHDYASLYIKDLISDKVEKIVQGEKSADDEQLHPFKSTIAWSPDGDVIAYVSRSEGKDVINLLDVNTKNKEVIAFEKFNGITNPAWSHDGNKLAFSALSGDQRDIYVYNLTDSNLQRITSDLYDDIEPAWSKGDEYIAFSSDAPADSNKPFEFGNYDIFGIDVSSGERFVIAASKEDDITPIWSPTEKKEICFISQRRGVLNIYAKNLDSENVYPVTNMLTGCRNIAWSPNGDYLITSVLYDGAWDLYKLNYERRDEKTALTPYAKKQRAQLEKDSTSTESTLQEMGKYVFSSGQSAGSPNKREAESEQEYTPKFTADIANVMFGYSSYYGFQGQTVLRLSDILGNHRILLVTDLSGDIEKSNFYTSYKYLRNRIDLSASAFYYQNYLLDRVGRLFSDRHYGMSFSASYPFSRFMRLDFMTKGFVVDRRLKLWEPGEYMDDKKVYNSISKLSLVKDNTLWGMTGPLKGNRYNLSIEGVPKISEYSPEYIAGELDYRLYFRFLKNYNFSTRVSTGAAFGSKPKMYFAGGTQNWVNYKIESDEGIYSPRDVYFSEMTLPLRGYNYFQFRGTQYLLSNNEFRYLFIKNLDMGFPPISLDRINGSLFFDACLINNDLSKSRVFKDGVFEDVKAGVGVTTQAWLGGFLLSWEVAWRTNLNKITSQPIHYFKLGANF